MDGLPLLDLGAGRGASEGTRLPPETSSAFTQHLMEGFKEIKRSFTAQAGSLRLVEQLAGARLAS